MKYLFMLMSFFLFVNYANAAEPFYAFEPGKGTTKIAPEFQAWQAKFEDNKDYGESWFFIAHTDEGGVLFALASITNLGLRTFDGIIDTQFYTPDGKKYSSHAEYKREDIKASTTKMDTKIGKTHAWGGGNSFHFTSNEKNVKIKLDVKNTTPPYMFGKGKVEFFKDKHAEWSIGMNTTRGKSSGNITVGGKTYSLKGNAYHDHGWSTIKMPDAFSKWITFRAFHEKYTLILHKQYLTKTFGAKKNSFGVLGVGNKLVAASRRFALVPKKTRKDPDSKYPVPIKFELSFKSGGYTIKGTIEESRFLESLDVLGQVSWPVRMVIKAFYSNPFMHRFMAKYELDVTDKTGKTEHISGECVMEANFF